MKNSISAIALLAVMISTNVLAKDDFPALKDATVLIIRHAEKPENGSGLTPAGEERAKAYVNYFKNLTLDGQPVKLDSIFAAADSKKSQRPRLTIEPTSRALGLPINSQFGDKDFKELAKELAAKPHGKAILIAWHHGEIPALLTSLGAAPNDILPKGKWSEDVFGWMIELRYDSDGHLAKATLIKEKLMPDDEK